LSEAFVSKEGEPAARKAFRDFYIAKGRQIFTERVQSLAPLVGVEPGEVAVKELGYHWASCGAGSALNFHWKTLMAPQTVIDYIVVHELCHLRHRDHSDAFWNEVDKVLPQYRERKEWLRVNGAALDL
jgi:predicted metal-dependent hydrolase